MSTLSLVGTITAVVCAVTDCRSGGAVGVLTLEGTRAAVSDWAGVRLIRSVHTILLSITLPEPRHTLLITSVTSMLTVSTVGYARLHVSGKVELVRASTFVCGGTFFSVTLDVQVTGFMRRCDEAQMRTPTVVFTARVRVWELPQWVYDMNIVWPMSGIPEDLQVFT